MKKKIIILVLALISCVSLMFVGCENAGNGDNTEKAGDTYLISSFDSLKELATMSWHNEFGKADIVTDTTFVKEGKGAMRVELLGNPELGMGAKPQITIFNDTKFNDKTDYTNVEKFNLDIYNESETDANIYFQFRSKSFNKSGYSSEEKFVLKAKQWNNVEFILNRSFVSKFIDIDQVSMFYLRFDNRASATEAAKVLYVDNFRATITDQPIDKNIKVREDGELESADRSEYMSAWETSNAASLSFNENPQYIMSGTGSFKWFSPATGQINWPRMDFKGNMLTDLTPYESIYFWIFNDNPDDYPLVIGGKTTCGTARAGEWSLIEITTAFLSNVPTFDNKGKEFDISKFTNFNMVVTSNNKTLTFYIDNFYARKAGEPIKGSVPQAKDIVLSTSLTFEAVAAGTTVTVPTITNVGDYESVSWKVAKTGMIGASYTKVNVEGLENATTFEILNGDFDKNSVYVVTYTAIDKDGKKAKATYSYLSAAANAEPMDITKGSSDGSVSQFMETPMTGNIYTKPAISLITDNLYRGTNGAKITLPQTDIATNYAFCWKPGFDVREYDGLIFSFLNTGKKDMILTTAWGTQIELRSNEYTVFTAIRDHIIAWANGAPDVHSSDPLEMTFHTESSILSENVDIILSIATYGHHEIPLSGISMAKSFEVTNIAKEILVKASGVGDNILTVPEGSSVQWLFKKNGVAVGGYETVDQTYQISEVGTYEIEYMVTKGSKTGIYTYKVVYDSNVPEDIDVSKFGAEVDQTNSAVPTGFAIDTTTVLVGNQSLKVTGNSVGINDIGFSFNTGVKNDLRSMTMYVCNASAASINLLSGWGAVTTLIPNTWTKIDTGESNMIAQAAAWVVNGGTQVKRAKTGEWTFYIPMNVSKIQGDYTLYFNFVLDKKPFAPPSIELDRYVDFATWNVEYTIPVVAGTTHKLFKIETDSRPQLGADNLASFTPAGVNGQGQYEVEYTKVNGDGLKAVSVMTIFEEWPGNRTPVNLDTTMMRSRSGYVTMACENSAKYGDTDATAVKFSGTPLVDYGMEVMTGITEDCYRFIYYLYNDSSVDVNHTIPGGGLVVLKPHSWTRVNAEYWLTSWPQTYRDSVTNEWILQLHFKFMGESTTGYDIYLGFSYAVGQSH